MTTPLGHLPSLSGLGKATWAIARATGEYAPRETVLALATTFLTLCRRLDVDPHDVMQTADSIRHDASSSHTPEYIAACDDLASYPLA